MNKNELKKAICEMIDQSEMFLEYKISFPKKLENGKLVQRLEITTLVKEKDLVKLK